jgi:hypothetical protein
MRAADLALDGSRPCGAESQAPGLSFAPAVHVPAAPVPWLLHRLKAWLQAHPSQFESRTSLASRVQVHFHPECRTQSVLTLACEPEVRSAARRMYGLWWLSSSRGSSTCV